MSDMGSGTRRNQTASALTARFPGLADLDGQDDEQRVETFRHVLKELQRELDESRDVR